MDTRTSELGVFYVNSNTSFSDIKDGSSNTFLLGEVRGGGDPNAGDALPASLHYFAGSPAETIHGLWHIDPSISGAAYMAGAFGGFHAGNVVNMAFVDGSVRSFSKDTDLKVVRGLSTIAGGEIQ